MGEGMARAIGTVGIWLAVSIILAFGVFRLNWNGDSAMLILLLIVVMVCTAASISTAAVWGWKPSKKAPAAQSEERQPSA
jgi:ABC-type maltose transport system permease subunit